MLQKTKKILEIHIGKIKAVGKEKGSLKHKLLKEILTIFKETVIY
jgi:hypothetical protein